VTTESGIVYGFDTRQFSKPVFELIAHKKACSNAAFSPHLPTMLATVGTDHMCKIWDIANTNESGTLEPKCILAKDMKQAELFAVQFYEDIPWVLATGGSKGELAIWDTEEDKQVFEHFKPTLDKSIISQKKKADKGLENADEPVEEDGQSSGFEDVDSSDGEEKKPKKSKKQK